MIYLDNAATTFPKPAEVVRETCRCIREYCGNPGRGSHYLARAASEKLFETRASLASLLGCESPENVVFTLNTTYAVNIALKAYVNSGDHVLISDMEHNSVLRPVEALSETRGITYSVFPTFNGDENKILYHISRLLRPNTKVLICQHSSNICGTVLPIKKIGELCSKKGIFFIVDAAQSAGLFDIDMSAWKVGALCVPSHKGLYGPQGAGAVLFASDNASSKLLKTVIEGGSGTNSKDVLMPDFLPDRFEAGTMPTPVIAGLCEGIDFVRRNTPSAIRAHEEYLAEFLKNKLSDSKRIKIYRAEKKSGIVLFNIHGKSSTFVSEELDKVGICTRAGFHCAPLAHKTLNTDASGAVRVSFGAFNELNDAKAAAEAIQRIAMGV